jgi:hypothetical protein
VCIGAGAAFALPFLIYQMLRRDNRAGMVETFKRLARQTRQPWQQEDDDLKELSQRVAALKKKDQDE